MKLFQKTSLFALLISIAIGFSSCLVGLRHDNGYRRGYYKNHRQYTPRSPRVYKMKPDKKYYYQSKPLKVENEHDDNRKDSKHEDNKKSKHSRR